MKLTMPLPPNVANARWHWAQRVRAKTRYYRACDERQNVGLIPAPPRFPFEHVTLSAAFYVHNFMDADNAFARLKFVQDWLVTRGYLVDDSPAHLTLEPITQEVDRKNKRLELLLRPTVGAP